MNGKNGPPGGPEFESGGTRGSAPSADVWLTQGHTASMSPDERARRGQTPSERPISEEEAAATEQTELASSSPLAPASDGTAAAALPVEDGGRYELEGVHARGGLGRVVRAHDRLLQRTVAIKELLQRTPAAQIRFMREALITARLQHPGIVPVHEAGRWSSGDPYYSMKLVSGRTLKELIEARKGLDERLALLRHVLAVAEAIAYAHSQNVIHRDIKPANVIVGDFGETVVVDWGLAKDLSRRDPEPARPDDEAPAAQVDPNGTGMAGAATAAGHIMGTPSYMAPEQARGEAIDARADVYSLGAMLYELLAGEPPHTGDSADKILLRALSVSPVPIEVRQPAAPPDLVAIVHKAMARRPADRYRSAIELAEDIRRFQTGQLVTARRYSARSLLRRWIARHRAVVAVVGAAAIALAATGAIAFQRVVAQRNLAEARSAEAQKAEEIALSKRNELVFLQAQSWTARDPTAALAWLKRYPAGGPRSEQIAAMVDEAMDAGVARHVLRQQTWVVGVGFTDGGRSAVGVLKNGEVRRWDVATGAGRLIGRHFETVKSAAVSPDGRLVAVGGTGGAVELFALEREEPPRQLGAHEDEVDLLVFSATSHRLMTRSTDGTVRVWDVAGGEGPLLSIEGEPITSAVLNSDGESVFVGLSSGQIVQVDVANRARRRLAQLDDRSDALVLSPDGQHLAARLRENRVQLIDVATGKNRELIRANLAEGCPWGFSLTGRFLAVAPADGTVHLHDLASGEKTVLRGHEDQVMNMAFSADDSVLLTGSDDTTARVWDIATGGARVLRGHEDDVWMVALSPDGKMAATGSLDASIRLWQLDGADEVSQVVGRIRPATYLRPTILSEDGGMLAYWIADTELETWNLSSGKRQRESFERMDKIKPWYRPTPGSIAEERGRLLAIPQPEGRVALWDLRSGERRELVRAGAELTALAVARDWRTLVTGQEDGTVAVWDLTAGPDDEPRVLLRGRVVRGAALTSDGKKLALAQDGRLELHDVASGQLIASTPVKAARTPSDQQRHMLFSRDGRFLASLSKAQSSFVLWDVDSGQARRVDIGGHEPRWTAFSPDSSRLAIAISDRTLRVVDTATGHGRLLRGHRDMVWQAAWSPDSKTLASASYDRTLRLWDLDTGRVRVLRGHSGSVNAVAFSADGSALISASSDETVRRWNLEQLPDDRANAIAQRLAVATSAIIDVEGRAATPDLAPAGRAAGQSAAAVLAPAR